MILQEQHRPPRRPESRDSRPQAARTDRQIGQTVTVYDETVQSVAYAHAASLGVENNVASLSRVAGTVEVYVDDARHPSR